MSAQTRTLSIIGSSNSRRIFGGHIAHLAALSGRTVDLRGGTTLTGGKAECEKLKGDDMAVISFITNTLVDECGSSLAEELDAKIDLVLNKYIEVIKAIPNTVTIIFMYPYPRVEPEWVFSSMDFIHNKLDGLLEPLGSHIHRFPYLSVSKEDFEKDFIHLKPAICLRQFLDFCASFSSIFQVDQVDLMDEFELISPSRDSELLTHPSSSLTSSQTSDSGVLPFVSQPGGTRNSVRPRGSSWGNVLPHLTPGSQRYSPRSASLKRPSTIDNVTHGAKSTRLNNGQSLFRDSQRTSDQGQQRQGQGSENTNHNYANAANNAWAPKPNLTQNGRGGGRGGGGGGRGRGSGLVPRGRDNNQSLTIVSNRDTETSVEGRVSRLEIAMVTNYELTETALNKTNAASVIIDCLPFGPENKNDSPVDVVEDLVKALGWSGSHVSYANFLNGGQAPPQGTFARIRAVFRTERAAFNFRAEATGARRRNEWPWAKTYVSNDPTKGTRVRIEILQQLAKAAQGTVEGRNAEIVVSKFDARPMLLFKHGGRIARRLAYGESLARFGRLVMPEAYDLARRIAGREYEGQMEVIFGIRG